MMIKYIILERMTLAQVTTKKRAKCVCMQIEMIPRVNDINMFVDAMKYCYSLSIHNTYELSISYTSGRRCDDFPMM